ncbi:MAG: hypothetical protein A3J28_18205 [Acidobacteria bacterium RIFCSPLOWO2_12_FULL_60_22]|nr:MAG: hypothetical protein A3J28_18205 [Acidobacteria bacterium RIFCSPLOWO2_12_FULL_60_22]
MKNFQLKFVGAVAVLVVAASTLLLAANKPLTATWAPGTYYTTGEPGVFDDGNAVYANGVGGVRCYFGVGDKNVVLVTYANPDNRKLHFVPNALDPAENADWASAGFPTDATGNVLPFNAEVDFFGPSHGGAYTAMPVGGLGVRLHADLEFHYTNPSTNSVTTFELAYSKLIAIREPGNTWLISSDPAICGPCETAELNRVRRKGGDSFGTVTMPIQFRVSLP